MDVLSSREHEMFRTALRRFLEQEAMPFYRSWEGHRMVPRTFWRKMGEQGYLCPAAPEVFGGAGADFAYAAILMQELDRVGSGLAGISLHSDIIVPYLLDYATEAAKSRWVPKCVTGELITAIAMTEPGAGSDLAAIRTTAVRDGAEYVLNGQKTFITNGIQADLVLVVCKSEATTDPHHNLSLIVVERGMPGFTRGRQLEKVGQHCQDTAELFLEECRVPAENMLGEPGMGFRYLMEKLQQERLLVAIAAQATAERCLDITTDYVKQRQAFGQPISQFQNTQFKIVEMATDIELGKTYLDNLIGRHILGENIVKEVSMAKWWISEMAKRVAQTCVQLHGGYGYMEEYEIARRCRDVQVMSIYAGTTEIMKSIIAKRLGL